MCTIYRFDCNDKTDFRAIEVLQMIAAKQKHNFINIFPWEGKCIRERVYVALSSDEAPPSGKITKSYLLRLQTDPIICGWLNILIEDKKRGYISQVSARAALDSNLTYKGVGSALIRAAEADAERLRLDFIYLRPLVNVVGFYKKIGYAPILPASHLMFKVLKLAPSDAWLAEQKDEPVLTDEEVLNEVVQQVKHADSNAGKKLMRILKDDENRKYEVLAMYQENEEIDDVLDWLDDEMDPGPMSRSPSKKSTSSRG